MSITTTMILQMPMATFGVVALIAVVAQLSSMALEYAGSDASCVGIFVRKGFGIEKSLKPGPKLVLAHRQADQKETPG